MIQQLYGAESHVLVRPDANRAADPIKSNLPPGFRNFS